MGSTEGERLMADYYDAAKQGNDQAKAGLVQAIRTQGAQARQVYEQAEAQRAAAQTQAVAAALTGARSRGASAGVQQLVGGTVATPYDRAAADLAASRASREASMGQLETTAGTYFDQANAALPVLRQRQAEAQATAQSSLQQKLAELQADAQGRHDQQALTLTNLAEQIAERRVREQEAAAKAAQPQPVNAMLTDQFGGKEGFAAFVAEQNKGLIPSYLSDFAGKRGGLNGPGNAPPSEADLGSGYAEAIGQHIGLQPGVASSIYQPTQQKQADAAEARFNKDNPDLVALGKAVGLSVKGTQDMLKSDEYAQAQELAELYVSQGKTLDDLKAALGAAKELKNKPKTRAAILEIYGGLFPSASYLP